MAWHFAEGTPVYLQIIDIFKIKIISGEYPPNFKLPTVREFTKIIGVNPNTIQKSLAKIEEEGLIYTTSTVGKFVTDDMEKIAQIREEYLVAKIREMIDDFLKLGIGKEELIKLIESVKIQ